MEQENDKTPVEQPKEASGDLGKNDSVAYESFQKALHEKKLAQTKVTEYEAEMQKLREEKLTAEGKKDELIATYKQQLSETQNKLKNTQQNFAWNTLTGEIKREALKHGCSDPDKLIRLMDETDLKSIEVGDNFQIDSESLKNVVEKNKKDNFFLFQGSTKAVVNGNPSNKPVKEKEFNIKDLSMDQIRELYKKQK